MSPPKTSLSPPKMEMSLGTPPKKKGDKPTQEKTGQERTRQNPPTPQPGGRAPRRSKTHGKPTRKRATLGKARVIGAWARAVAIVGSEEALLAAVLAYAASDYARSGGKPRRFDRWLDDGGYEAFTQPSPVIGPPWSGPPELWRAVAKRMGEGWAKSYLGSSTYFDGQLFNASRTLCDGLARECGDIIRSFDLTIQNKEQAA